MTNASELKHLQKAADSVAELSGDSYFGHLECPRENLSVLMARGVLIAEFNCFPSSLLARAMVCIPATRFVEFEAEGILREQEWFPREGADALSVPSDLSLRTVQALESDLTFCRWHLAARTHRTTGPKAPPVRNSSENCFRIYDATDEEIRLFEMAASRVADELRRRERAAFEVTCS